MGFQIPNFDESGMGDNDDDDDDDLEAELQRLQQGSGSNQRSKANQRKPGLLFFCQVIKDAMYVYRWTSTKSSIVS
jgi:hypothetical protein